MGRKSGHFSLSRMYDYTADPGALGRSADEHLWSCRECQVNREFLTGMLGFAARERQYEPPEWAIDNAIKVFRLKKPSVVRFAQEILATLVYDSFNEPLPAGVRQRDLPARQTLYQAEGLQLDLKVQVTGEDKGLIVGQVVSENADFGVDELEIALSHHGELIGASSTNAWGEFVFEDLPKGEYELQVQFGEKILRLPKVPLGKQ